MKGIEPFRVTIRISYENGGGTAATYCYFGLQDAINDADIIRFRNQVDFISWGEVPVINGGRKIKVFSLKWCVYDLNHILFGLKT